MEVAAQTEFKVDRREPLGVLLRRIAARFADAGLQPALAVSLSDGPIATKTSAVDRALKKHPHLAPFERNDAPLPNVAPVRRLTSDGAAGPFPQEDLFALADGVPRALPFHEVIVQFRHADFGDAPVHGITVRDSWWVSHRTRSLVAVYALHADAGSKELPDAPACVRAILEGFGKPQKSRQFVRKAPAATPAEASALAPIVARYRAELRSTIERIGLPHDLPPEGEARAHRGGSGPLKPTVVDVFAPRGYDCHGGSGTFTLQRRTPGHNVAELYLDVGTWSRSVLAMFRVRGPGFTASLQIPATARSQRGQYPIGDADNWRRIVENFAAAVDELDRTFVTEIEAVAGPAPSWFDPGRS